jgi:pheromone shutdown protein TraB
VAVVGAGHTPGITRHIHEEQDLGPLTELPPPSRTLQVLKWAVPVAVIALLVTGFVKGGAAHSAESLLIWLLVNGTLSAIGAAAALAHPLTILVAFLAAPITSLSPMIAAGFVAGIVQAWIRTPTVADIERLPADLGSAKGFWINPLSRILLVAAMANIGSSIGTLISGGWIAARVL